ncbi:sortilin-like isoform X1 [Brienomyrus brachyistius]|uniref:sortilin-like isoform X1 n=1 Tax=Brienomyrus brachyistius TaxID=42636 RepID=UPI0020B2800A|nr:sortilin-like isoform X1 [Brienomyrus brachyistius]
MSPRLRCCLLVIFLPTALCLDLRERSAYSGGSQAGAASVRTWEIGRGAGERSGVEKQRASTRHQVRGRSIAGDGDREPDACGALRGYEAAVADNTHSYVFNDLSGSVSLAWVGDGTGVVLALTTFQVPFFMVKFGQSKLYRSTNYGKTFQDVTNLINNTFILTEFGIAIGPQNSGKVILTADVSGYQRARLFRSVDFGNSFTHADLPFQPLSQVSYSPHNTDVLLVISLSNDLWLSEDFGGKWRRIHQSVCQTKWGAEGTIFFTTSLNASCTGERGRLELRKTTDFGETFKTIGTKIFAFGLGGRFIFASVMTGRGSLRVIHVSMDQGEVWNMAQLPPVGHEQFYSILAANDDMVFMHVDEPGDTGFGTIYVSDDRGTVYSKSLERHLYTTTGGDTDFTNITSLRGVYMTSVLAEDSSVQTVITFDQGGEWRLLQRPRGSKCDGTAKNKEVCSLHVHASFSMTMKLNVPMLPLSEPNAVGLILAHGSVGDGISVMTPDVYVSDDGGYSWLWALRGPHHYAILDSGGLLVAVEHTPSRPIHQIKFSTDEGQCWHVYNFTQEPLFFTGLASEPGAHSMNVSVWGYREVMLTRYWVSITVDFGQLFSRDCDEKDYVQWLAHSDDISNPDDGCMLGYKEKFLRLRKDSVCLNGRDYVVNKQPTPCRCTLDDFLCDFGYYRHENSSECLEQPDLQGHILEFCLHGRKEQLQTSGYRKIPGDKCEAGFMPERKMIDLSVKCVSNLLETGLLSKRQPYSPVTIVAAVIVVMLMSAVAGVLFVKKYVCGGRFLVHRYSVLRQHAEANGTEGLDELDNQGAGSGKRDYHDDSDEDLLE